MNEPNSRGTQVGNILSLGEAQRWKISFVVRDIRMYVFLKQEPFAV